MQSMGSIQNRAEEIVLTKIVYMEVEGTGQRLKAQAAVARHIYNMVKADGIADSFLCHYSRRRNWNFPHLTGSVFRNIWPSCCNFPYN
ncbi:MAG: TnpV protein [Lachnospiraceae bacterium]|nr:TnpV protein [Lachnospiraceae bacterium]